MASLAGMATRYGLYGYGIMVRFPAGERDSSCRHSVQTGSGAHQTSHAMDTGCSFTEGKAAGRLN
jgi:hypothetical protein